ncbi:MAG: serine/threonine protein kinase, partial [Deltaproteobacteria bacterium]|nr:serine/threonine protein kinase [Deltaproteobacteria bacterium]
MQTPNSAAPRRLGPYELIQPLGAGGMAEVWMGRRVAMGGVSKTVAIKLLAGKVADNPEYQRLFMSEARLSMLLSNSNIVQVFDIGEDQGVAYMAMEWVDGLNLAQLCQRMAKAGERLAPVVSVYIVAELLRALAYAHGLSHEGNKVEIIHRDVSPQNVMLSVSGEIKLMDFGIARLSSEDTSGVYVKGKLRYMPPEQLRGNARKPTVDLFAVGAILHELLEFRRFRSQVVDARPGSYGMILDGEV